MVSHSHGECNIIGANVDDFAFEDSMDMIQPVRSSMICKMLIKNGYDEQDSVVVADSVSDCIPHEMKVEYECCSDIIGADVADNTCAVIINDDAQRQEINDGNAHSTDIVMTDLESGEIVETEQGNVKNQQEEITQ